MESNQAVSDQREAVVIPVLRKLDVSQSPQITDILYNSTLEKVLIRFCQCCNLFDAVKPEYHRKQ